MSILKFKRSLLVVGLLLSAFAGMVSAEESQRTYSNRKGCDYDRSSANEESTRGGCTGTVPTPEPVTILLFSAGLAGVGFVARRKLRRAE